MLATSSPRDVSNSSRGKRSSRSAVNWGEKTESSVGVDDGCCPGVASTVGRLIPEPHESQ